MKKRWLAAMLGCALLWQQCGSMALASEMMEPVEVQQEADEEAEGNEAQQEEIQEVEFSEEDSEKGEALEEKTLDELQETEEKTLESEDGLDEGDILSESISKEIASVVETGSCGENATYTLDEDGTLVISGAGAIEKNAFYKRQDIKEIVIEKGITEIGQNVFSNCSNLQKIVIGEDISFIDMGAFAGCTDLNKLIVWSDDIRMIGGTFWSCRQLKTAGGIGSNCNIEFATSMISYNFSSLFQNCESIIIPEGAVLIGGGHFNNCKDLKEVILPSSLEVINNSTFSGCSGLTKITIPDSVRNIESSAFSNCTNLQELTLPEGIQEVSLNAFSGCTSLTKVSIESEQVSLGANAFQGCTSLKSVNSAGKLSLGDSAFDSCTALETFDCKGGVTAAGAEAFYNCGKLRAITLAEPLSEIRGHAFNGCSSLTEITLPKTVTQIRTYAFHGCKSLKDIYILNGNCKIYSNANTISETAVIHGQAISTAKEYASQYKRKFVALSDDNTGENNGKDDPKADMPEPEKKGDLYDDVPETSGWRYEAIKYVKDHGIMNGISGTRNFAPDEPLTRAMFATIIYRMEGSPKASYSAKFPDVPDGNYFSVPIIWANKAGIINGHSNTGLFGTRENITREDMVVIMYRYCKVKGLASGDRADLGRFPDADQISGYAKEAVQWAVANGIINGRSNTGMLDPKGNASRVETAAIIQRFMTKIK